MYVHVCTAAHDRGISCTISPDIICIHVLNLLLISLAVSISFPPPPILGNSGAATLIPVVSIVIPIIIIVMISLVVLIIIILVKRKKFTSHQLESEVNMHSTYSYNVHHMEEHAWHHIEEHAWHYCSMIDPLYLVQ